MPTDSELLPTGELRNVSGTSYDLTQPQPVADMMFDDVWTGLVEGKHPYIQYDHLGIRVIQEGDSPFSHVVLYTQRESDLSFICLEPQTGSTNAINLHQRALITGDKTLEAASGLTVVEPGAIDTGTVLFHVQFYS